ncbi:hypothetical protein RHGRI_037259 [Rhododendron griersonianum]|uniref:Uncharacterized protein n=1 Tax=Rhododendron griersonianum TaxID=479676 RepID=A0AAV6HR35_9ERIC|nr:hypothetical protein RHGRI_037259 [Rhododendron griersonianum]
MFQVFCRLSGNSNFRLIQYRVLVESSSVCLVREGNCSDLLFMVFGKARPAEPVDYNKRCPLCKIPVLLLKLNGKARMGAQQWSNAQDSLLGLENNNVASVVEGIDGNQNLRAQFSSDMSSTLEDVDFPSKKLLSSIDHSLQLDHDAYGNLYSMILPCCGELREPKGGHYHNIVEIMKNAGKCLLSEYALRISKYHLNIAISDQQSVLKFGHLYLPALQLCSLKLCLLFCRSLSFVSNKSFAYLILRKWSSKWLIVLETCWTDILMFSVYNQEVYFYAINTNAQALLQSAAKKPLQIGELFTRGLALVLSL